MKCFTGNDRENPRQKICLIIDLLLKIKSTALHESLRLIVTKDFIFFLCFYTGYCLKFCEISCSLRVTFWSNLWLFNLFLQELAFSVQKVDSWCNLYSTFLSFFVFFLQVDSRILCAVCRAEDIHVYSKVVHHIQYVIIFIMAFHNGLFSKLEQSDTWSPTSVLEKQHFLVKVTVFMFI